MDVKLVDNFLIEDNIFGLKPDYDYNNTKFSDFFITKTMKMTSGVLINEYLLLAQGN